MSLQIGPEKKEWAAECQSNPAKSFISWGRSPEREAKIFPIEGFITKVLFMSKN